MDKYLAPYLIAAGLCLIFLVGALWVPSGTQPVPPAPAASAGPYLEVVRTLEGGLPMRDGIHYYAPVQIVRDPIGQHCFLRSSDGVSGYRYVLLPERTPDCR